MIRFLHRNLQNLNNVSNSLFHRGPDNLRYNMFNNGNLNNNDKNDQKDN